MTDKLPPNLLALFAPRPPLRWVPPSDFAPEDRKTANITGLAAFLPALQEYKETDVYEPTESWLQRKDRVKLEKKAAHEKIIQEAPKLFKPSEDPNIRGDAFKTLIVSRLDYDATEKDLEREFGRFGPIERIRIVVDTHQHEKPGKKIKKHRGYAFVVFEREKDMRAGLENCDGIRIKDRRIKVDVERGRTVKGWLPRRLGGGLGGRGYTKSASSRPMGPGGFNGPPGGPGGFRGGFRGGFDGGRGRGGFRGGFDRGGFGGGGGGGRGGIGFQGRGGFGDRGDRGGYGGGGGGSNGYAPPNAPAGPGGGGRGGFNGGGGYGGRGGGGFGAGSPDRNGPGGSSGGYESRGGRSYDDRSGGYRGNSNRGYGDRDGGPPRGGSGSNMEPVRPRDGSGYRDRDGPRDGPRDGGYGGRPREDDSRKRPYDSNGYEEDPRKLRRY
ncbi:hypothetical protein BPAE_0278g00090 [Botrytis paeoniae]|uniref:RRM domain-containing protein n=1 Tax=Botrytis paeoniae TaxID=278948 RepID=A0A4Z1F7W4_9HELO|nr:hypothetical protein BPAE_0278g00090 [Botrytis paeoniae]